MSSSAAEKAPQRGKGIKLGSKSHNIEAASSDNATSTGWDFDSDWSSFDPPSTSSATTTTTTTQSDKLGRQEELQRKREERRQRQQEAREKRAAGAGRRPAGLGAVKKD